MILKYKIHYKFFCVVYSITRSYYRKEYAASSPSRNKGSVRNLLNKHPRSQGLSQNGARRKKDPGFGWSHVTQILGDKLKFYYG
jgi:hypothetical protein